MQSTRKIFYNIKATPQASAHTYTAINKYGIRFSLLVKETYFFLFSLSDRACHSASYWRHKSGEITFLIKIILQTKQTILHVYGNIFILPCQQLFEKSDVIVVCNNSSIFQIYGNNTECNISKKFARKNYTKTLAKCRKMRYNILASYGGIAQLVRALASHARGRRFESYCLYQVWWSISLFL